MESQHDCTKIWREEKEDNYDEIKKYKFFQFPSNLGEKRLGDSINLILIY